MHKTLMNLLVSLEMHRSAESTGMVCYIDTYTRTSSHIHVCSRYVWSDTALIYENKSDHSILKKVLQSSIQDALESSFHLQLVYIAVKYSQRFADSNYLLFIDC